MQQSKKNALRYVDIVDWSFPYPNVSAKLQKSLTVIIFSMRENLAKGH
jgi:hypothetical protein